MASAGASGALEYAEEERTFDFGEEEFSDLCDLSVMDYGGEDFSKYMSEDDGIGLDEVNRQQLEPATSHQNFGGPEENGSIYDTITEVPTNPPAQTNQTYRRQHTKQDKFRRFMDHVSKATKTNRVKNVERPRANLGHLAARDNPNKIYNFSFADSKMGCSLAAFIQERQQPQETSEENADSGIGVDSSSEVPDVINELPGLHRSSWWSLGTLSSRLTSSPGNTVSSNSSLKRHSTSTPSLVGPQICRASQTKTNQKTNPAVRNSISIGKMWKKVTNTISKKPKSGLRIKTEEIHF